MEFPSREGADQLTEEGLIDRHNLGHVRYRVASQACAYNSSSSSVSGAGWPAPMKLSSKVSWLMGWYGFAINKEVGC